MCSKPRTRKNKQFFLKKYSHHAPRRVRCSIIRWVLLSFSLLNCPTRFHISHYALPLSLLFRFSYISLSHRHTLNCVPLSHTGLCSTLFTLLTPLFLSVQPSSYISKNWKMQLLFNEYTATLFLLEIWDLLNQQKSPSPVPPSHISPFVFFLEIFPWALLSSYCCCSKFTLIGIYAFPFLVYVFNIRNAWDVNFWFQFQI